MGSNSLSLTAISFFHCIYLQWQVIDVFNFSKPCMHIVTRTRLREICGFHCQHMALLGREWLIYLTHIKQVVAMFSNRTSWACGPM